MIADWIVSGSIAICALGTIALLVAVLLDIRHQRQRERAEDLLQPKKTSASA